MLMKLNNVDITGIDTVVIHTPMDDGTDNVVVFKLRSDTRWEREGKNTDIHTHDQMVNKIKKFTHSPYHKVWINGTYVNVLPTY